jgi:predicted amino acid racemase
MRTIYIKPPAETYADDLVKYADISLNSSFTTLKAINEAAAKANKVHKVIIMVELGELREGVNQEDIMDFYEQLFELKHIDVIGIGSNLGCMYGIEPTHDKLMQLSLYKELIAERYDHDLPLISGGTSITLPLVKSGDVPQEVNHFRIGEAAFFGISPLENKQFDGLHTETFEFEANIIEVEEKKLVPEGTISDANIGHTAIFDDKSEDDTSVKAILDFGLLDVDKEDLKAADPNMEFVGITSDMIVVDIGENKNEDGSQKYHIGDKVKFIPNYMAVARLLNSKFVEKRFVD